MRRSNATVGLSLAAIVFVVVGVAVAARSIYRAFEARQQRRQCEQQLHMIAVAIQNYADQNSAYPPAIVRDAQGAPMHSWRVLILPHLGAAEEQLHTEYHYDEPWNGPHNRELADRMPAVYRCPEDPGTLDGHTSYLGLIDAATGEFAAYPTGGGNAPPKKPPRTAYLVVEQADSGIHWMEPRDIALAANGHPARPFPPRFSYHVGGSMAVDANGDTIVLSDGELAQAIVTTPASPGK